VVSIYRHWRETDPFGLYGVPRPAAVLVGDGRARPIRRRETVADLLSLET